MWIWIGGAVGVAAVWLLQPVLRGQKTLTETLFPYVYNVYVSPVGAYLTWFTETDEAHSVVEPHDCGSDIRIVPVPVLQDNFAYLVVDTRQGVAAAVDPADPKRVLAAATREGVRIVAVLTTHAHWDHSGGNARLAEALPGLEVYGSRVDNPPGLNKPVQHNERFQVGAMRFVALASAAHTRGHVMFLLDMSAQQAPSSLFTGDALFVAGCGRFFEGNGMHFRSTVELVRKMPPDTLMWPGHEYSLSNLAFAASIDGDNSAVMRKAEEAAALRAQKRAVIPTRLADELTYNPFLRPQAPAIARQFAHFEESRADLVKLPPLHPLDESGEEQILTALRKHKDTFTYVKSPSK